MYVQVRRWVFWFCVLLSMFTSFNVEKVLALEDSASPQVQAQSQVGSGEIKILFTQLMIELFGGYFVFKILDHLVTKIIDSAFKRYIG
ncbi:MAG: hypothetical protein LBM02_05110 [Lachnospiraceae bacterium]|nr:hypothetical protein [Lachnospiraceae bacterium]